MSYGNRTIVAPFIWMILTVVLLAGCVKPDAPSKKRFFWPPPPVEAKIEYINFYASSEDLLRGLDRRLENAILGKRTVERLFTQPYTVASDGNGRLFAGDFGSGKVVVLDRPARKVRELSERTAKPQKVLVDDHGEIWVFDSIEAQAYRYSRDEVLLQKISLKADSTRPTSIAVDALRQRLYVSDTPAHRVCIYDYSGKLIKVLGRRGSGDGEFNYPTDLDLDRAGNLYVVDSLNSRIEVFDSEGVFVRAFGERGTEMGSFSTPKGVAVSAEGIVYVTDAFQNKVVIFNTEGDYLLTLGGSYIYNGKEVHPGGFNFPVGIDVDKNESIFVADFYNGMIHEFQYLTPEYLLKHPLRSNEVYVPSPIDFKQKEENSPAL